MKKITHYGEPKSRGQLETLTCVCCGFTGAPNKFGFDFKSKKRLTTCQSCTQRSSQKHCCGCGQSFRGRGDKCPACRKGTRVTWKQKRYRGK